MVKSILTFITVLLMFTSCNEDSSVNNSSNLPGEWIEKAEMPEAVQEIMPTELDGKIYVVGGWITRDFMTKKTHVYDPTTDSWTTAANFPYYRNHVATASCNGKLYAFGGFEGRGYNMSTVADVFEYNPASDKWTEKSPMPTARGGGGAICYNGIIYLIGGRSVYPNIHFDVVEAYNPATDVWETKMPMLIPCLHSGYVLIGNLIYVVAGRQLDEQGREMYNLSEMQVYSPLTDSWEFSTELPQTTSGLAAATLNGKLYAMGGEVPFGKEATIYWNNYEYNPVTESWREVAKLPVPRHGTAAVTIGNYIYLPGGARHPAYAQTPLVHAFTID